MASTISARLNRYKLNSSFSGKSVTHVTRKSNLEAKQRRIEVQTVWNTEDRLGAGAFGVVWRQRADNGQVRAVKVISRAHLNIQEVEALIELQDHPDLFIRFFGWFEDLDRDAVHIAMEYIEHGHLGKYIAEYQMKVETKEITSQILEGLAVLHEREICHRDLKPQNILVASLSPIWVKITDFGISKRWVGTSLKTNCGTAIYRSPEQLGILPRQFRAAGNSYTNQIDIWALGAIVHEMLTLQIPFLDTYVNQDSGFTMSTVEDMVDIGLLYTYCQGGSPFPCGTLRSHGVPEDGIEFVKHLMAVNPSERLSAAAALASEWLIQVDSTNRPTSPKPVLPSLPLATSASGLTEPSLNVEEVEAVLASSPPATIQVSAPTESGSGHRKTNVQTDYSPHAPPAVILLDAVNETPKAPGIDTKVWKGMDLSQSGSSNTISSDSPIPSEDIWSFPSDSSDSTEHWETHTNDKNRSRRSSNPPRLSTSRLDFDGGINWPVQYTAVNHPSTNATSKQLQLQSKSGITSPQSGARNVERRSQNDRYGSPAMNRPPRVLPGQSGPSTDPESIQSSGLADNPSEQMRMRGLHYPSSSQIVPMAAMLSSCDFPPQGHPPPASPYRYPPGRPSLEGPTRWGGFVNGLRKTFRKSTPIPSENLNRLRRTSSKSTNIPIEDLRNIAIR